MTRPESVVIVGASAAGLAAAEALRRKGYDRPITLIGDEPHLPYDRPPLSKQFLAGTWGADRIRIRQPEVYAAADLNFILGERAVGLDRQESLVHLASGRTIPYGSLVIATGVRPRKLAGAEELRNVHVLRNLDDAVRLRADLAEPKRLLIVGAGFLGCEVAAAARVLGCEVTLVDPLPTPMWKQLGGVIGGAIKDLHHRHGVEVRSGMSVVSFRSEADAVQAVHLSDGTSVDVDIVLVAIGSTPATQWLAHTELSLSDGIECDVYCRAAPGIYAAGDVASWPHPAYGIRMRLEHRMNATEQGENAALNLLGERVPFSPMPYFWSDQFDVKIQAYGILPQTASVEFVVGSPEEARFVAICVQNGVTVGAVGWNAFKEIRPVRQAIQDSVFSAALSG